MDVDMIILIFTSFDIGNYRYSINSMTLSFYKYKRKNNNYI